MTLYKVKNGDGDTIITPSLSVACNNYCIGRRCPCRLGKRPESNNPESNKDCTVCTDAEILRRFGNEIEILHDWESEATEAAPQPNLAALKLYSEAQRLLGFIDGITQGPQMQNNAVSDAVEALSELLDKWRDLP